MRGKDYCASKGSSASSYSSFSSISSVEPPPETASLVSFPSHQTSHARTISKGSELLQLRKTRLQSSFPIRRKLLLSLVDFDTVVEDLFFEDIGPHTWKENPNLPKGFERATENVKEGRHWPGRGIVLAVRNALLLGMEPMFEHSTNPRKRHRPENLTDRIQVCPRKKCKLNSSFNDTEKIHSLPELSSINDSHESQYEHSVRISSQSSAKSKAPGHDMVQISNKICKRAGNVTYNASKPHKRSEATIRAQPNIQENRMSSHYAHVPDQVHRRNQVQVDPTSQAKVMPRQNTNIVRIPHTPQSVVRPLDKRQVHIKEPFRSNPELSPPSVREAFPRHRQLARTKIFQPGPKSHYRALPLTSWPQPCSNPRLSSYNFAPIPTGREGENQSGRSAATPNNSPVDIFNKQFRQDVAGWRELRPSQSSRTRMCFPQSNGCRQFSERRASSGRLFPNLLQRNQMSRNQSLNSNFRNDERSATPVSSQIREKADEERAISLVSRPREQSPQLEMSSREKERAHLKRQLKLVWQSMAQRRAEFNRQSKSLGRRSTFEKRCSTDMDTDGEVFQTSGLKQNNSSVMDKLGTHTLPSPVTSSGECIRNALAHNRREWLQGLSHKGLNSPRLPETQVASLDVLHDACNSESIIRKQSTTGTPATRNNILGKEGLAEELTTARKEPFCAARRSRSTENHLTSQAPESFHEKKPTIIDGREDISDGACDAISAKSMEERNSGLSAAKVSSVSRTTSKDKSTELFNSPCRITSPTRLSSTPLVRAFENKKSASDCETRSVTDPSMLNSANCTPRNINPHTPSIPHKRETFIVKAACRYGWANSTRRLSISTNTTFPSFRTQLEMAFDMTKPFTITYRDEEGDFVKISSESEMVNMVEMASKHARPMQVKLIPPHGFLKTTD